MKLYKVGDRIQVWESSGLSQFGEKFHFQGSLKKSMDMTKCAMKASVKQIGNLIIKKLK